MMYKIDHNHDHRLSLTMYRATRFIHIWSCQMAAHLAGHLSRLCLKLQNNTILAGKHGRALCISVHAELQLCAESDCSYQGMTLDGGLRVKQGWPASLPTKLNRGFMLSVLSAKPKAGRSLGTLCHWPCICAAR